MLSLLSEHKLELFLLEIWGRNESLEGDMLVPLVIRDLVRDNGMLITHSPQQQYYASGDISHRFLLMKSSRSFTHKIQWAYDDIWMILSWEIIKTPTDINTIGSQLRNSFHFTLCARSLLSEATDCCYASSLPWATSSYVTRHGPMRERFISSAYSYKIV